MATDPAASPKVAVAVPPLEALRTGDVHVWYVDLAVETEAQRRLAAGLSEDERARAARFVFARDTRRFVVARSALRALLAGYLDVPAAGLAFVYGPHGKPALAGGGAALGFNLSHSGEIALIAVAWERALGIDVEQWRSLPDLAALAARSFSPRERAMLDALPESQQPEAFFCCWTRKEAFIKATGEGLAHPLDAFTVSLAPGEPARFLDIDGDPAALARWTLHELRPPAGYSGALVVEGPARTVQTRWWSPGGARS